MSLQETQDFLARIYTNEKLRGEFLSAPEQIGKANDLTEKEIREIVEILPVELSFFADSLFHKRLREAEKLIPFTKEILADEFEKLFREFANQFNPVSIKKHLEDAIRFAEFLQTRLIESDLAKDAAKFEQAKLEFYGLNKIIVFRIFDFDLKEISRQKSKMPNEIRKKRTIAIWLRIGKREIIL